MLKHLLRATALLSLVAHAEPTTPAGDSAQKQYHAALELQRAGQLEQAQAQLEAATQAREQAVARFHREQGWACATADVVEDLVEQLERSPAWELVKDMPLGEWAHVEELLRFYRDASDL